MSDALPELYGGIWSEHPDYPVSDWQHEVANDDTRLGYWPWVSHCLERDAVLAEAGEGDRSPGTWAEFENRFGGIVLCDAEQNRASVDPHDGEVMWQDLPRDLHAALVWTVVEGDDADQWSVVAGIRSVNRVGYVIAVRPRSGDPAAYRDYLYDD
jgi:hypothetical protein